MHQNIFCEFEMPTHRRCIIIKVFKSVWEVLL
jgi:hypothetical protein